MKIIHYSRTPLASAPWHISCCLKKHGIDSEVINEIYKFPDGRVFPYNYLIENPISIDMIKKADIIHIHNQLPANLVPLLDKGRQKIYATLHSTPKMYNWNQLIEFANKSFVIRQPMQISDYKGIINESIPTSIDIDYFKPMERPTDKIIINYSPSTTHPISAPSSKGYHEIIPILTRIKEKYGEKIIIDYYRGLPHIEDLKRKQKAHIIIDDVVHNTYHLTGLFGLSFGCAVLEGIKNNEMIDFYNCNFTAKTDRSPFVSSSILTIFEDMCELIENPSKLEKQMKDARAWMETFYNPKNIVDEYKKAYYIV